MGEQLQPGAGGASVESVIEKVRALPTSLAARIGATAEALSLLDSCTQFPTDSRLVAQAVRGASLLGRVQRDTARAAPLCVLVDMAALQRRPGALAACLRWLLGLPNLRALRFADGGKGSMLSEEELALLLQLVAVHPEAAGSLHHIGIATEELVRQFDAGVLMPFPRLRSLRLRWFWSADLANLPHSVHSVELLLPGNSLAASLVDMWLAAGQPEEEAVAEINELYQQLGWVQPLISVPAHHLTKLHIEADGLPLRLSTSQLFGAAAAVQLIEASRLQLPLPLPNSSLPCISSLS
ncbi:glycosyl transferase family 1 [Chlorella sorokiniana]|uniref:Glycosyl transferase family 1 n=1 Tax=Chlorella sorokiniana TaxID=3076 RepID=A0A2P6TI24_CHLSO|nr:glycosyl transferase family 1 [Chlorella sorokiniana]|eukprot:PRW33938.1 glycosyl transferase family 1 [Chlorella sorokiniana]